ncbi:uncharacterized protein LOC107044748 [Diachasma alloeum]|uniref:uncharacterized protein LOC107044748 n=1 Tax=Diachasma alloeum TaxID=454923 RepID=UPI0007383BFD|nr:uncharacterized protein LOC107044748 [Diachasma alloeum]
MDYESVVNPFYDDDSEDIIFIEAVNNYEKKSVAPVVIDKSEETGELENALDGFYSDSSDDIMFTDVLDDYESKSGDNATSEVISIDSDGNIGTSGVEQEVFHLGDPAQEIIVLSAEKLDAAEAAAKKRLLEDSEDENNSPPQAGPSRAKRSLLAELEREVKDLEDDLDAEAERVDRK